MSKSASCVYNEQKTYCEENVENEGPIKEASDENECSIREATVMSGEDSSDELIDLTYAIPDKNKSPITEITINEPSVVS